MAQPVRRKTSYRLATTLPNNDMTMIAFADSPFDADAFQPTNGLLGKRVDLRRKATEPPKDILDPVEIFKFNDPLLPRQWHIFNRQTPENDVNVTPVWQKGITGKGVTVCIIDDGIDHKHKDLSRAFRPDLSYDFNEKTNIPIPNPQLKDNHGTRCAGLIAAEANNEVCGVGVAFNANVSAIRILSRNLSVQDEASAVVHKYHENHIYSCSWGPADNGMALDGPSEKVLRSFIDGVTNGRNGKGSIYVFASGNGKSIDNCNFDGYANGIFSTTIGAIDHQNSMPAYMEPCSAQLAVTYSSGIDKKIVTTDLGNDGCTLKHGGTSAAAALSAGVFALVLEARPDLTWRDLQYLIVKSAKPIALLDASWQKNGAGNTYSQKFGFGKIDAERLVANAQEWKLVGPPTVISLPFRLFNQEIRPGSTIGVTDTIIFDYHVKSVLRISNSIWRAEHVTVTVDIEHANRGRLQVFLRSPSGMVAQLATRRPMDKSGEGLRGWTFMTVAFWGEAIEGPWTLNVVDKVGDGTIGGRLLQWRISFWGEAMIAEKCKSEQYAQDFINNYYPPSPDHFADTLGLWTSFQPSPLKPTKTDEILAQTSSPLFPLLLVLIGVSLVVLRFVIRRYRRRYYPVPQDSNLVSPL